MTAREKERSRGPIPGIVLVLYFLLLLYLFFFSIELMSAAFKLAGRGFAEQLVATAADPLAGLIIGFLATSLIQSSSTTTTIVVGLVASGALSISVAIPMVMGANIGTTMTNTIVSMGHVTRSHEFARAFAASTVHDFFNILAALTLLPIEVFFHPVERSAHFLETLFEGAGGMSLASPLKLAVGPPADFFLERIPYEIPLLVIALGVLFFALSQMMKVMRGAVLDRLEGLFSRVLFRNDFASFSLGVVTTAAVQSSSATTSLVVPLAGTGVLSLRQIYPYTLGANLGTTVTAILASMATANPAAVTVALAHLTFNLLGIAIYYPLRAIPIWLAEKTGVIAGKSKGNSALVIAVYLLLHVIPVAYVFMR
jgi:sodium-dependent phosphate cotransporter